MVQKIITPTAIQKLANIIKRSKAESPDASQLSGLNKGDLKRIEMLQETQRVILSDDELRAFYSILRDAVINSGYEFVGDEAEVKKAEKLFKKLKFRKKMKRITFSVLTLLHAYIEVEQNKAGEPLNMHVPDAARIYPEMTTTGKILRYKMDRVRPKNSKKKPIVWTPEEMCHLTVDESTADYYGVTYVESLKRVISLKKDILDYIDYLFKSNAFRVHYHGEGISEAEATAYYDMIKGQYEINDGMLITAGETSLIGHKYVDEKVLEPLIQMLNMLRNRILTLIRVPPIIAGTVDNSNRSNSDVQAEVAFRNRIRAIQEDLEDDINFELLPLLNLDPMKIEFRFKKDNIKDLSNVNNIMVGLLNANAKSDKVVDFIRSLGYPYPKDLFPKPEEMVDNNVSLDKNSTLHQSRAPQDNFDDQNYGKLNENNRD